jgi:hypothetical protein
MIAAAFQSLGISDDTKVGLNRLAIGVATMAADNFRKRGFRFCSSIRASAVRGAGQLTVVGVASMASRREMLIEILNYRGFIGGDSVS